MNFEVFKIAYTDVRMGNVVINPIFQFVNFLMLFYIVVNEYISIYVFAPIFLVLLVLLLLAIGKQFRKIQSRTDLKLQFEKNIELAKTFRIILESMDGRSKDAANQIEYLKKIEAKAI